MAQPAETCTEFIKRVLARHPVAEDKRDEASATLLMLLQKEGADIFGNAVCQVIKTLENPREATRLVKLARERNVNIDDAVQWIRERNFPESWGKDMFGLGECAQELAGYTWDTWQPR